MWKRNYSRIRFFVCLTGLAGILSACASMGCYEDNSVRLQVGFYQQSSSSLVAIDSVSIWGVGSDSLLYNNKSLQTFELDLNPLSYETRYVIRVQDGLFRMQDTLTIRHQNQPWYESSDCGCVLHSSIDTCFTAETLFESVTIQERQVQSNDIQHILLNI